MAKDLYESRQMYQSPLFFLIIIPIGMIILFFAFDFGYRIYNEQTLKRDTKEILMQMMNNNTLETEEDYKAYAVKQFGKLGYETSDVSVMMRNNVIILINYKSYFTMINEIIGGEKEVAVARFKGYYNEYKEAVVEEIDPEAESEIEKEEKMIN